MDSTLESIVKRKIDELKDTNFQLFINTLYTVYYPNFTVIKQKHDKGSDGIIDNSIVVACYAPEKYLLANFKKKIDCEQAEQKGDFQKYRDNWQEDYTDWQVVFNGEWTAEMIQYVQGLKRDTKCIGLTRILQIIQELTWTKKNQIFNYLQIDDNYRIYNVVNEIVDDIVKDVENENTIRLKYKSPKLEKKIPINYSKKDLQLAQLEAESFYQNASIISDIIGENTDKQTQVLRKIIEDYNNTSENLSFKKRKEILIEKYAGNKIKDDYYCRYINDLLLYVFEKCLIGKEPKQ